MKNSREFIKTLKVGTELICLESASQSYDKGARYKVVFVPGYGNAVRKADSKSLTNYTGFTANWGFTEIEKDFEDYL